AARPPDIAPRRANKIMTNAFSKPFSCLGAAEDLMALIDDTGPVRSSRRETDWAVAGGLLAGGGWQGACRGGRCQRGRGLLMPPLRCWRRWGHSSVGRAAVS